MKLNINTILPIALSIILPGVGIYSSIGWGLPQQFDIARTWLSASILSYTLWYGLWFSWRGKRRWIGILMLLVLLGIIVRLHITYFPDQFVGWNPLIRIIPPTILFLSIQYAMKAQESIARLQLEKEQIQTENYKAQLKALRAKIDPHFLFNSLNTLRSMVRQQHSNSEKFIVSLSGFYRQTLKHEENSTLPLSEELAVLESYLFVMKSRNEAAIAINLNIDEVVQSLHIPTLALQIVLENCFKHNSMSSRMPLQIEISSTADKYIQVSNNIQPKLGEKEPSGFGLDLLRKRYALMDIEQGVIVEETPEQFVVQLKLIKP